MTTYQWPVFGTTWHFRQMPRSQPASTTSVLNVQKFPKKYFLPQTAEVGLTLQEGTLAETKAFVRSFVNEVKVTGDHVLVNYTVPMPPPPD